MSKSVVAAYNAYPLTNENKCNNEINARRLGFQQGYEQAEKEYKNQWISVEEALPPYEYVLTCQDDNGSVQSVAIEIYQDSKWYGVDDEVTDREPDYWMLIPSFSKEKK